MEHRIIKHITSDGEVHLLRTLAGDYYRIQHGIGMVGCNDCGAF